MRKMDEKKTYQEDRSVESQLKECRCVTEMILLLAQAVDAIHNRTECTKGIQSSFMTDAKEIARIVAPFTARELSLSKPKRNIRNELLIDSARNSTQLFVDGVELKNVTDFIIMQDSASEPTKVTVTFECNLKTETLSKEDIPNISNE